MNLHVEQLYKNTNNWKRADDEFNRLFRFNDGSGSSKGINNVAGFRPKNKNSSKSTDIVDCAFCVLVTNLGEAEWPDHLDKETGLFRYYGDNRVPGKAIDATPVGGNRLLQSIYGKLHTGRLKEVSPLLCFETVKGGSGTYMRFLGLACPGAQGMSAEDDLVGVWRIKDGKRFQNYRATLSILREAEVARSWLEDLVDGISPTESSHCPVTWRLWATSGRYRMLECEPQLQPRKKTDQLPSNAREQRTLEAIYEGLTAREFEFAAVDFVQLLSRAFTDLSVTQASRDGGRDVIGKYRIGHARHRVSLDVFVEAKKWKPGSAVGVRPMMRLISRLKHRDVGVFVTTSHFDPQVQQELIDDKHPVLLVSGVDVSRLLIDNDMDEPKKLAAWLQSIRMRAGST